MKTALINALIDETKTPLSRVQRAELLKELLKTMSYREINRVTNIPIATMHHWVKGRNTEYTTTTTDGRSITRSKQIKYNLQDLNEYFKDYKPRLKEFEPIKELIKTLQEVIKWD